MESIRTQEREFACFGDFELDIRTGELRRARRPIPLRPLASRALVALVKSAGRILTRTELCGILWPDAVVEWNQSLNQCMRQVRKALGDDPAAPLFVQTVPRLGYRFMATVTHRRLLPDGSTDVEIRDRSRAVFAFLAGSAATLTISLLILTFCIVLARP